VQKKVCIKCLLRPSESSLFIRRIRGDCQNISWYLTSPLCTSMSSTTPGNIVWRYIWKPSRQWDTSSGYFVEYKTVQYIKNFKTNPRHFSGPDLHIISIIAQSISWDCHFKEHLLLKCDFNLVRSKSIEVRYRICLLCSSHFKEWMV